MITDLLSDTPSMETFLLCSALLANLTMLISSNSAITIIATSGLASLMTQLAMSKPNLINSVFIREQVVTVLASLARLPQTVPRQYSMTEAEMTDKIRLLLHVLNQSATKEDHTSDDMHLAEVERTIGKSAVALSWLCTESPLCADMVVRSGGLDQMLALVRQRRQTLQTRSSARDDVDAALMTAVRSVTDNCSSRLDTTRQSDDTNGKEVMVKPPTNAVSDVLGREDQPVVIIEMAKGRKVVFSPHTISSQESFV